MLDELWARLDAAKEAKEQRKEELARLEWEKAEEEARKERERIRAEKAALMALSDKELMVEAIMALRGYNTRLEDLDDRQNRLDRELSTLDDQLSRIDMAVAQLNREK